jgi:osmotically inducible lipoprotein OsmB
MTISRNTLFAILTALTLASLTGCAGMTKREKNTAAGAAIGGAVGVITGAGALGTAAGVAAGGYIGHQMGK